MKTCQQCKDSKTCGAPLVSAETEQGVCPLFSWPTYTLWSYDVWGNAEDGYEVNDRSAYCRDLEIETTHNVYNKGTDAEFSDDLPSDRQILDALQREYFRNDVTLDKLEIDGDDQSIYITAARDGRPICGLELNE